MTGMEQRELWKALDKLRDEVVGLRVRFAMLAVVVILGNGGAWLAAFIR